MTLAVEGADAVNTVAIATINAGAIVNVVIAYLTSPAIDTVTYELIPQVDTRGFVQAR